jgi:HEAT repeat protein
MRSEAARVVRRDSLRQLVPRLLVRLREETNPRVRRLVAEALSGFDGPEVTAALLEVGPRFPPALLALKQRRDTSLAAPLIDIYDAVADTAGRQRRDAILSALEAHLRPRHARTVVRWYRSTSSERRRAALLGLAGRLKTPVSDSLLASALSEDAPKRLRLLAADLTRKHGTRRPDALASVVRRQGDSDVRRAALQALAATGGTGFADAMVDHAPPPCAPPPSRQGLSGLWASFAEWLGAGEKRPTWAPEVLDALRKAGQAAAPDEKAPAVRAAARYLTCDRFPAVRLVAARTLFGIDPQAAAPTLRAHLAEEPSRRVRREIEHLLWVAGSL